MASSSSLGKLQIEDSAWGKLGKPEKQSSSVGKKRSSSNSHKQAPGKQASETLLYLVYEDGKKWEALGVPRYLRFLLSFCLCDEPTLGSSGGGSWYTRWCKARWLLLLLRCAGAVFSLSMVLQLWYTPGGGLRSSEEGKFFTCWVCCPTKARQHTETQQYDYARYDASQERFFNLFDEIKRHEITGTWTSVDVGLPGQAVPRGSWKYIANANGSYTVTANAEDGNRTLLLDPLTNACYDEVLRSNERKAELVLPEIVFPFAASLVMYYISHFALLFLCFK